MGINNIFQNPIKIYKQIREEIPKIKILNQKIMNKIHSLKKSEEFWWAITGEHAIYAYYLVILSKQDARVLVDIKNSQKEKITVKQISAMLSNILFRDQVVKNDCFKNKLILDDLFTDDYIKNFENIKKQNKKIILPFSFFTSFLEIISFIIFNTFYIFKNIKNKMYSFFFNKENIRLNFKLPDQDLHFEFIYLSILPNKFNNEFPKWFIKLSDKIISSKNKWITNFGYELNIFQNILIATSYEKFGEKYIEIVPHGSVLGEIDIWYLWRFSLFPNLRINSSDHLQLPKYNGKIIKKGILFCPITMPYIGDFLSLNNFRLLMDVHKKAVNLFIDAVKNGKTIKVRYKDFNYLRGHAGQFVSEETRLPVEIDNFENIYQNYSMVVTIPQGSISEVCRINNIPFISYFHPIYPTDRNRYKSLCNNQNIFSEETLFLNELKKIIDSL